MPHHMVPHRATTLNQQNTTSSAQYVPESAMRIGITGACGPCSTSSRAPVVAYRCIVHKYHSIKKPVVLASLAKSQSPTGARAPSDGFKYLELHLPPPDNARINKAVFVKSSASVPDCPPSKFPEFAVIGRSNVGKSSLINCLTGNDKLAKVSKEPGVGPCCMPCVHGTHAHVPVLHIMTGTSRLTVVLRICCSLCAL